MAIRHPLRALLVAILTIITATRISLAQELTKAGGSPVHSCDQNLHVIEENVAYATHHSDPVPDWAMGYIANIGSSVECQTECTNAPACRYMLTYTQVHDT